MAWVKSPFRGQFVRVAVKAATDAGLTVKSVLINTANGDIKLDIDNSAAPPVTDKDVADWDAAIKRQGPQS